MNKIALITGITGQTGSYLTEFLLNKGYTVHGMVRRCSTLNTERIDHLYKDPHDPEARLFLHFGDMSDSDSIGNTINKVQPDEVYNLAAQSHVRVSFDIPEYTADIVGNGVFRILEAIRRADKPIKYYQASSSEMFGSSPPPQNEDTLFRPMSPYAISKVTGFYATSLYRDAYGIFTCNGILFNHESPRRGETFVTRKITKAVAKISMNRQDKLFLGNLDAKRDWGYAGDYVKAMWMMMQHDKPDDYVIATGETHSVRDFVEAAFSAVGLNSSDYVDFDPRYLRPTEVDALCGDATKAREVLGWKPDHNFADLVKMMVEADCEIERMSPTINPSTCHVSDPKEDPTVPPAQKCTRRT